MRLTNQGETLQQPEQEPQQEHVVPSKSESFESLSAPFLVPHDVHHLS